jgi:DNA-binding response OmpR family regulator
MGVCVRFDVCWFVATQRSITAESARNSCKKGAAMSCRKTIELMNALTWVDYAQTLSLSALKAANVTVYPESHELFIGERSVPCSFTLFYFLELLLSNFCKTVSHERLMRSPKCMLSSCERNRLRVQICYLKKLLRVHGAQLEIRTVRQLGYQARPIAKGA